MRLINKGSYPLYSSLANATIKPGRSSRDLDSFEKAFSVIKEASKGFDIMLSDKDIHIMAEMFARFVAPALSGKDVESDAAVAQLKAGIADPGGAESRADGSGHGTAALHRG